VLDVQDISNQGRNTTTVLVEGRVQFQGQLVFVLGQTTQHTNSFLVKKRKKVYRVSTNLLGNQL
jgi:Tfp pilus assembly protein PilW